jgi:cytochrome c
MLRVMSFNKTTFVVGHILIVFAGIGQVTRAMADAAIPGWSSQGIGSSAVPPGAEATEQIKRGEATYLDECARCHAETLGGTEFGPPVVGDEFVRHWAGKNADDIFVRIRETMPIDSPGRLTAQQSVDLVAFLLRKNDVRFGDQPLTDDAVARKRIMIGAPPGR